LVKASVASSATGYSPSVLWESGRLRLFALEGLRAEVSMNEPKLPKFEYYLDESDPDIVVLRRQDGAFVAAFSARGATKEGIMEAAKEDYRQLLLSLRAIEEQARSLDERPEHTAIIERSGTIVAVNRAWKRFAKDNGAEMSKVSEGANYLDVCERAKGEQSHYAQSFGEGLRSVLSRREERFALEYPCHSPTQKRWFVGRVERFTEGDSPLALVAHENVTDRKKAVLAH
jgi:PAS domain-containing protein